MRGLLTLSYSRCKGKLRLPYYTNLRRVVPTNDARCSRVSEAYPREGPTSQGQAALLPYYRKGEQSGEASAKGVDQPFWRRGNGTTLPVRTAVTIISASMISGSYSFGVRSLSMRRASSCEYAARCGRSDVSAT